MGALLGITQGSDHVWQVSDIQIYSPQEQPQRPTRKLQLLDLVQVQAQVARAERQHEMLANEVRIRYVLEDQAQISQYLSKYPRLFRVLLEASAHLDSYFPSLVVTLRVTADEQGWEMLYATVLWPGAPAEALETLDRFDEGWWLAESYPAGVGLTFTYKLI